jgi:CrcB protein
MMLSLMSMMIVASLTGVAIRWGVGGGAWGLLAVNVAGSVIVGFGAGLNRPDSPWLTALMVGFCGCLTTFSGFALMSVRLIEQGEIFKLALHFTLNNAMCLALCYAAFRIAQKI